MVFDGSTIYMRGYVCQYEYVVGRIIVNTMHIMHHVTGVTHAWW